MSRYLIVGCQMPPTPAVKWAPDALRKWLKSGWGFGRASKTRFVFPLCIDKIETLKQMFGGATRDWSKMKTWDASGQEIHFYRGPGGIKVGVKPAGQPDPF